MDLKGLDTVDKIREEEYFYFANSKFTVKKIVDKERDDNLDLVFDIHTNEGELFTIIVNEDRGFDDVGLFYQNKQHSLDEISF